MSSSSLLLSRSMRLCVGRNLRLFSAQPKFHDITEEPSKITLPIHEVLSTTAKALVRMGWDDEDASAQAEILTSSELRGNNHGLNMMNRPEIMTPAPGASKPTIERETRSSAVINGNQSPGMLVASKAANLATDKLLETNSDDSPAIVIVSSYNTSTSSGQLGYFVDTCMARQGVIGIGMANNVELVAAAPGGKPVFGTNPLAVAIPTNDTPFCFDMATSAIAYYGIVDAYTKGEKLPDNVAFDANGNWTNEAAKVLNGGCLATFGGHKGTGLALCVELLAGALSGASVLGQVESKQVSPSWGHTFIAIQPSFLVEDFPSKTTSVLEAVKASGANIRIPGEHSSLLAKQREATGVMSIPVKVWHTICDTAADGVSSDAKKKRFSPLE